MAELRSVDPTLLIELANLVARARVPKTRRVEAPSQNTALVIAEHRSNNRAFVVKLATDLASRSCGPHPRRPVIAPSQNAALIFAELCASDRILVL